MVRAWYMDNDSSVEKRKPHQTDPLKAVTVEDLKKLGILYFENFQLAIYQECVPKEELYGKLPSPELIKDWEKNEELKRICKDRDYNYEDSITCTKEGMSDLEEMLVIFYTEHIHVDEEVSLITDGSGYIDVRDKNDKWIRINVMKNDMIILPAGIYHRFTLDEKNYIKANLYFTDVTNLDTLNRPAEDQPSRKAYLEFLAKA